ncbi:MAG: hypothetical protein RRZ84_05150 [Romboutsia sp.]
MKKKIVSLLAVIMILVGSMTNYIFANENKGKVIFIDMNRSSLTNMLNIDFLGKELSLRGYIGLMNTRGDKNTDDKSSYATMGAGSKANTAAEEHINFQTVNKDTAKIFEAATGEKPKEINDLTINISLNENSKGSYGATLGAMGQTLSENGLKVSAIGNADIVENGSLVKNRNIGLIAMDEHGRIDSGNVDDINIEDSSMPFGIRTDYNKLIKETKKYYNESDAIFIELGDTYRLDKYKLNLNQKSYDIMKEKIHKKISIYLEEVFSMVGENDTIYIANVFPSKLDYKNRKRFSTIIKFDGEGKGILTSSTTRREGVVSNLDVGVDILNEFGLKSESMVGKSYKLIDKDDNVEHLLNEAEKMTSISEIRSSVVNTFVAIISVSWVIAMLALLFRNRMKHKEMVFTILKEIIKLGIIMPLALLLAPILNFKTDTGIVTGIVATTVILYMIGRLLFKNDIKNMAFFATVTIVLIAIDSVFGTYLMQNNIMSYDAMIGSRYYGIGNEYEGVTIAAAVFGMAVLLQYKRLPKYLVPILLSIVLVTSAYPSMGANVGGAISEFVAYFLFVLLIFDIKLDFKKVMLIGVGTVGVVALFAILDLVSGSESHLGLFVKQILLNGPSEIIQTFVRKIQMNIKLAQSSVWINILIAGIGIISMFIFRPNKYIRCIINKYPMIFKGFVASMVGCIVTLLVNDSGIVAAATASIYILIPLLIISINMIIFDDKIE